MQPKLAKKGNGLVVWGISGKLKGNKSTVGGSYKKSPCHSWLWTEGDTHTLIREFGHGCLWVTW
jgi:hypothetical protein